jgi:UDP-N-acetylglucosamine 1-carboxyvinyltransferase
MDKFVIRGGKKLVGEVLISGSKNSALPIIFATLLTENDVILSNVPCLKDIDTAIAIIEFLGKKVLRQNNKLIIKTKSLPQKDGGYIVAPYDLVRRMRASFLVSGALLAKNKKVKISLPGGCAIGVRPVDIHITAFEKLGCKHHLEEGYVVFERKKLSSAKIRFKYPSVGATEDVILLASLIDGETIIENAACEPEIVDLAEFIKKFGVKISGAGTKTVVIQGVKKVCNKVIEHTTIPDRIETGTYLIATAATKGEVLLKNVVPQHNSSLIKKLNSSGLKIVLDKDKLFAEYTKSLVPQNIVTKPYPGFPTDLQAQFMALMCITKGQSVVKETVFDNRFVHVAELQRMGANIVLDGNYAYITGVKKLIGCPVMVSDLRAGAALVIAGLVAEGETVINRIYHLDRGYELLEQKLSLLGADIKRIN